MFDPDANARYAAQFLKSLKEEAGIKVVRTVNGNWTANVTKSVILQALATRPGVVKSRNALMDAAYDDQVYVDDRTIDSHIKRLRKKFRDLDDNFDGIETLYGVGYRYKEA